METKKYKYKTKKNIRSYSKSHKHKGGKSKKIRVKKRRTKKGGFLKNLFDHSPINVNVKSSLQDGGINFNPFRKKKYIRYSNIVEQDLKREEDSKRNDENQNEIIKKEKKEKELFVNDLILIFGENKKDKLIKIVDKLYPNTNLTPTNINKIRDELKLKESSDEDFVKPEDLV